jgi:hypothetical protein
LKTCYLVHAGFSLSLFFEPEDGGEIFLFKCTLTFNGVQGIISQKIENIQEWLELDERDPGFKLHVFL